MMYSLKFACDPFGLHGQKYVNFGSTANSLFQGQFKISSSLEVIQKLELIFLGFWYSSKQS